MSLEDNARITQFGDSICTCKSCSHRIAADPIRSNCNCSTASTGSIVLDGIEGFAMPKR